MIEPGLHFEGVMGSWTDHQSNKKKKSERSTKKKDCPENMRLKGPLLLHNFHTLKCFFPLFQMDSGNIFLKVLFLFFRVVQFSSVHVLPIRTSDRKQLKIRTIPYVHNVITLAVIQTDNENVRTVDNKTTQTTTLVCFSAMRRVSLAKLFHLVVQNRGHQHFNSLTCQSLKRS